MRLRYSLLLLACAACGGSDTPYAATGTGMLVDVRDEHGKLVRGAEVTTKPAISAEITDSSGTVLFDHVKPGQYKVSARDDEYGSATEVVQVASGKTLKVHLMLDGVALGGSDDDTAGSGDDTPDETTADAGEAGSGGKASGGTGGTHTAGSGGGAGHGTAGFSGFGGIAGIGGVAGGGGSSAPGVEGFISVNTQVETMMVDPTRPYLYALDRVNNNLLFVNLDDKTLAKTLFVGSQPVDMDITDDASQLFIANFGSTEIAVVDLETQEVARTMFVDTTQGGYDGNPYRLALTAFDTLVYTSEDQWNDIKLVNATNGGHITASNGAYEPDLIASPDGTHVFVAESGLSSNDIQRYDVTATTLTMADSGNSGSNNPSGISAASRRYVAMSGDGMYVFYWGQKMLATNLKSVLGQFGEMIYASNMDGSIVFGQTRIFNGTTFQPIRALPVSTAVMALSSDEKMLYLYDVNTSRIYYDDVSDASQ
jgi:DNA-binding beta-propeller fold protein YncE